MSESRALGQAGADEDPSLWRAGTRASAGARRRCRDTAAAAPHRERATTVPRGLARPCVRTAQEQALPAHREERQAVHGRRERIDLLSSLRGGGAARGRQRGGGGRGRGAGARAGAGRRERERVAQQHGHEAGERGALGGRVQVRRDRAQRPRQRRHDARQHLLAHARSGWGRVRVGHGAARCP
jgi:hypothetical protein